jgi:high-affinity Fe2+/Pb2+ permease
MKTLKKIIGGLIVSFFILLTIFLFAFGIYEDGIRYLIGITINFIVIGLFLFGIYLLTSDE